MKKIILKGPFLTQSGYGHHTRTVLRALRTREDLFDIYLQPVVWGRTSWIWKDDEERKWIDSTLEKTIAYTNMYKGNPIFDASIQVTIPNEWEKIAPINIGITAGIETTKIAPQWIEKSRIVDKVLTISKHSKDTFVNTVYEATRDDTGEKIDFKCQTPVEYVSYPVIKFDPVELDLNLATDFNFLTVAQMSPRKNAEQLIKCFVDTFRDEDNVGLIVKANMAKNSLIDRINSANILKQFISSLGEKKCKIYLLHGFLSDNEMASLYTHPKVKAFVSATHGEGFGLPILEAAVSGLPLVVTDWSGHKDIIDLTSKSCVRLSYNLMPLKKFDDNIFVKGAQWAEVNPEDAKRKLRKIVESYSVPAEWASELQGMARKKFHPTKLYKEFEKIIEGA